MIIWVWFYIIFGGKRTNLIVVEIMIKNFFYLLTKTSKIMFSIYTILVAAPLQNCSDFVVVLLRNEGGLSLVLFAFFRFSGERLDKTGSFLALNFLHPKGNHPSKFQLIRINRFWGVREQTNKHTNALTHSLTFNCFYRVMSAFDICVT